MLGNDSWLGQFQFLPAPWCDRTVRDESWRVKSVPMHISYYGSWFFFLLAFASCLTPMILGQHLSLKAFYFYFFKTASKRCKRAYRALLMILSETKPARSLDTSSLFPGLFPAIRINKTQQLLCRMYPTSPIMLFPPVSQEYPHIIKKRFCVPWMRCPINRVDPKERFHCT